MAWRSMSAITVPSTLAGSTARADIWLRRVLVTFSITAVVLMATSIGIAFWAENSLTGPECVVAAQSIMLAHDGTMYYDLNRYPYTVMAYTPLFYLAEAGLYRTSLPIYAAGRLISIAAFVGICALVWKIVWLYTSDRYCAWTAALLCASSSLLLSWGTVGQVDTLALFWALAAFYQGSRYLVRGENTLLPAAAFCVLAFFTKQTYLACLAALTVALWLRSPKMAIRFVVGTGSVIAAASLALNWALSGRFFADTVFANMNPFSAEKMIAQLRYALLSLGPLALVAGAGIRQIWNGAARPAALYLAAATTIFGVTAPKIGSDLNYQMEMSIALILCTSIAIHSLGFFQLTLAGSKNWITLLQLPLALFVVVNCRVTANQSLVRVAMEQAARAEAVSLAPYFSGNGRVLSADYNAAVRYEGRLDVEMLIYRLLVEAGKVDPEPVRRDLAAGAFSSVILMQDVSKAPVRQDVEISSLPENQIEEVRKHYALTAHLTAAGDLYVYRPREEAQ